MGINSHQSGQNQLLNSRPIAIDFFSGVGGLSLGLELAGFVSGLHIEVDPKASQYAKYNFPFAAHFGGGTDGDIQRVSSKQIMSAIGHRDIALIAGGPPCQGFSRAGRRRVDDPLNNLVLRMSELILELQPRAFLIENVPGIRQGEYWQLEKAIEMLASQYQIEGPTELFAPEFGVPQIRKRVFVLGTRSGEHRPQTPTPTHTNTQTEPPRPLPSVPTVWDAISDIPDCDAFPYLIDKDTAPYSAPPEAAYAILMRDQLAGLGLERGYVVDWDQTMCTNIRRTQHGKSISARLKILKPGKTDKASRIKRLDPCGLSTTVRAGTTSARGAWSAPRPCHPTLSRVVTTRESARFQSFP
ncbi:MAG: DNA (cytosine-5)-methyltransferase 1, partial [Myxococcota bacterium]